MNTLTAIRAGYGVSQVLWPAAISGRLAGRPPNREVRLAERVLGGRQFVQAAISATKPTRRVMLAGASIDGLHALSMLGLAVAVPQWRRLAIAETLIAVSFGIVGVLTADGHDPQG